MYVAHRAIHKDSSNYLAECVYEIAYFVNQSFIKTMNSALTYAIQIKLPNVL